MCVYVKFLGSVTLNSESLPTTELPATIASSRMVSQRREKIGIKEESVRSVSVRDGGVVLEKEEKGGCAQHCQFDSTCERHLGTES